MNKRKLIISLTGVAILIGGIAISRVLSSAESTSVEVTNTSSAIAVRTVKVKNNTIKATTQITGRVIPTEKVDLYAEVTGVSRYGKQPFKTGHAFKAGQVLLTIDSREQASSLASVKSTFMSNLAKVLPDLKLDYSDDYPVWKAYLLGIDVDQPINPLPEVKSEKLKLFLTGRGIFSAFYSIKEAETRLSKFVIRAPFNGTLKESNINQGALVRTGQKLGEMVKDGRYELEAAVLNNELQYLKIGDELDFQEVSTNETYAGRLVRINEHIDPDTQLVTVYFKLLQKGPRTGLYLKGEIPSITTDDAVELPVQALVDNQFVFLVKDGKAIKQSITLVQSGADQFIAKGLEDGAIVIIDKKNSAFEGSAVIEL